MYKTYVNGIGERAEYENLPTWKLIALLIFKPGKNRIIQSQKLGNIIITNNRIKFTEV